MGCVGAGKWEKPQSQPRALGRVSSAGLGEGVRVRGGSQVVAGELGCPSAGPEPAVPKAGTLTEKLLSTGLYIVGPVVVPKDSTAWNL